MGIQFKMVIQSGNGIILQRLPVHGPSASEGDVDGIAAGASVTAVP